MSEESERSMNADCIVLQFCSATCEGLDGVATEDFAAENFGYKRALKLHRVLNRSTEVGRYLQ
jgi:hypothetical protein